MKLKSLVILLFFVCYHAVSQETVYIEADKQIGRGILRARGNECFVITPAHVVQESLNEVAIIGAKIVESTGKLQQTLSSDLAIVRVTGGGLQKCEEWEIAANYNEVLENAFEGFLEVKSSNGSNKLIKVLLTEKEDSYTTIRPYFQDDKLIKGLSGSSLFCSVDGKKVFMGLLMEVDENGKGIVLNANTINKLTGDFFKVSGTNVVNNVGQKAEKTSISLRLAEPSDRVVEISGFKFVLIDCKRYSNQVVVKMSVTSLNKDNYLQAFGNSSYGVSRIYDENGNQYLASNVKLGTQSHSNSVGHDYTFVRGVSVPLELTFEGVYSDTKGITLVRFFTNIDNVTREVNFRNISLSSTTNFSIPEVKGIQTQSYGGFKIDLVGCRNIGGEVIASLYITSLNKDSYLQAFGNSSYGVSRIYDENGNQYLASNVKLGTQSHSNSVGHDYTFVRGVPVPLELTFEGVYSETKGITLIRFFTSIDNVTREINFRNISLNSTTNFSIPEVKGIQTQSYGGFKIDLVRCRNIGGEVIASLYITSLNKDSYLQAFGNSSYGVSRIYDENGNQYLASNVKLGTQSHSNSVGHDYTFVRGVPVPLEFTFEGVYSETKGITLIRFFTSIDNVTREINFRNISLSSTTNFSIPEVKGIQTQSYGGFKIDLIGCQSIGGEVIANFYITSINKDNYLQVYGNSSYGVSSIYDEKGNQHQATNVKIGTQSHSNSVGHEYTFVRGVPVSVDLHFNNMDFEMTLIEVLDLYVTISDKTGPLRFKKIPIKT